MNDPCPQNRPRTKPPNARGFLSRASLTVLALLAAGSLVAACTGQSDVPEIERRAQEINKGLMCPVCPGESIDQSQNTLAKQMRELVLEKLQEGSTEEEIKAFFVERYGPRVLMAPPQRGADLLVWVLPPAAVVVAVGVLFLVLRSMRGGPQGAEAGRDAPSRLTNDERAAYEGILAVVLESDNDRAPHNDPER